MKRSEQKFTIELTATVRKYDEAYNSTRLVESETSITLPESALAAFRPAMLVDLANLIMPQVLQAIQAEGEARAKAADTVPTEIVDKVADTNGDEVASTPTGLMGFDVAAHLLQTATAINKAYRDGMTVAAQS